MSDKAGIIVVLPGDGIGGEVTAAAIRILENRSSHHGMGLEIENYPVGGRALEQHGEPLPDYVLEACRLSGTILLGAVGDSRFDSNPPETRPEKAILKLRSDLGLFANLRPVRTFEALLGASTLKPEVVQGVDLLIVRELTGGIYFGEPRGRETRSEGRVAYNSEVYHDYEIERIARIAFEAARGRRRLVTSVDKSNVLESSQLWRAVVEETAPHYPDVELDHILVDNCAMQLIREPARFDVLLTNNMFGDILSDEAAMLTGSLGMLPSASLGTDAGGRTVGLYEPVHGTAPDIAGENKANPLAAILSAALLLRHSLGADSVAGEIESAVERVLQMGLRTPDIAQEGDRLVGTEEMTEAVLEMLSG